MSGDLYLDLGDFAAALDPAASARLAGSTILFVYPLLKDNVFELAEHPVSSRILVSTMGALGCAVASEFARIAADGIAFSGESAADAVVIHPMIGSLPLLPDLVRAYRRRFPAALIVLQNSDQHQHEKLIGGPEGWAIAARLMERIPELDWIIVGFADHALASLLAGRPTEAVLGRAGKGHDPIRYLRFASLPDPVRPQRLDDRDRSIRVQRARGCLSGCTYCIEGQANRTLREEKPWDGLPIEEFVERLAALEQDGYFFVNVTDSTFEDPGRKGIRDLIRCAELLVERGIRLSFKIHLRAETVLKLGDADLALIKQAGIDVLVIGLESGSDVELGFYNKIADSRTAREAVARLEAFGQFCAIYGYMMFSPIATLDILRDKIGYLRDIGRGWDFLNLTNRVLVFQGTVLHKQLIEAGLADESTGIAGYVDYRFADPRAAQLASDFNVIKRDRPGFARLNNAMYDALNLVSRFLNPANRSYREQCGEFEQYRIRLDERCRRLSRLYADGFERLLDQPGARFLPDFDPAAEAEAQARETALCLAFVKDLPEPPTTLYLHTWLSVVNASGVEE